MKRILLIVLLLPLLADGRRKVPRPTPEPGPLTLESFHQFRLIETPKENPLYQIDIPEAIYSQIQSDDLRDVRIFNANGDMLPHSFQLNKGEEVHETEVKKLGFYPILGEQSQSYSGSGSTIEIDGKSEKIRVKFGRTSSPQDKLVARGFLIDLRKSNKTLRRLELDWDSAGRSSFLTVELCASDDLIHWRPVGGPFTVARFDYGGQRLEQNVLDVPDLQPKYLSLTWREQKPFSLKSLKGEFAKGTWVEPKRHTSTIATNGTDEGAPTYLKPPVMADRVEVHLSEPNTLIRVNLESRSRPDGRWNERYSGLLYRLKIDNTELNSSPIKIYPTADRYWRVSVIGKDASLGHIAPILKFGWTAHQLFFLGRGEGPYKMAYGNSEARSPDFGFESLVGTLAGESTIKPVPVILGTEVVLQAAAKPGTPAAQASRADYKKMLLWGSLLACVLITSLMAWKLYGEMGKKSS